jgi:hypothetical protein
VIELVEKHGDGTFSLNTTLIFPKGSAVTMTLEGRRKRLREAVANVLLKEGWQQRGKDIFLITLAVSVSYTPR